MQNLSFCENLCCEIVPRRAVHADMCPWEYIPHLPSIPRRDPFQRGSGVRPDRAQQRKGGPTATGAKLLVDTSKPGPKCPKSTTGQ